MTGVGPKDLIFTLFGDYIHHRGGEIWTGSLIHLLQALGVSSPQAVRAALSRMTQSGWLKSRRVGRQSYYSLTLQGQRLFDEGDRRIFATGEQEPWDGRWWILTYRIPDEQGHLRARLRHDLGWMGFGRLDASLYISPYDRAEALAALFERLPVGRYVDLFVAEYLGPHQDRELVARAWDLPDLNRRYRAFLDRYRPQCERDRELLQSGEGIDEKKAFVRRFALIHEYRAFPFIDPALPAELLPDDWAGGIARRLFQDYHTLLTTPALAYFDSVFQAPDEER